MPELPEVETMRRGVASIVGSRIRQVRRPKSRLRPITITPRFDAFRRRSVGRRIVAVDRAGKRVVLRLDSADAIVFEPRMTGRLLVAEPPDQEHLRLIFDLSGRASRRLLFWNMRGLGVVRLLSPPELARQLGPRKLGPDALVISRQALRDRLGSSGRAIKVALMDQKALAGIGNLYASEILHRAKVHPQASCRALRPAQWQRIHQSMRVVLEEAIRLQGSTLADGNYRNAQNEAGAFQEEHRVYQREGQRCRQCGRGRIARLNQAQRSTFFCPNCQRRGKSPT